MLEFLWLRAANRQSSGACTQGSPRHNQAMGQKGSAPSFEGMYAVDSCQLPGGLGLISASRSRYPIGTLVSGTSARRYESMRSDAEVYT